MMWLSISSTETMGTQHQEVALVIGSSRGIGRQIAIDLAKAGFAGMLQG